jgi:hypothetical protein
MSDDQTPEPATMPNPAEPAIQLPSSLQPTVKEGAKPVTRG